MELDEEQRHASEVRAWVRKIREQPPEKRKAYWQKWLAAIVKARGPEAAKRVHQDVVNEWWKP